jgi:hypothetical protein
VLRAGRLGRPDWVPKDAFVVDMHTHTNASQDGKLSPEQLVRLAIENGYNGIAVTDHNTTVNVAACQRAAAQMDPNFVVVPGYEWSTMRFHANVYGLAQMPEKRYSAMWSWPSEGDVRAVAERAKAAGGYVQYNHPGDYSSAGVGREFVKQSGFSALEVLGGYWDIRCPSTTKFCSDSGLLMTCGSDTHAMRSHPRSYLQILPAPDGGLPKTAADVLQAIKEGRTQILANSASEKQQYSIVGGVAFDESGRGVRTRLNPVERALVKPWQLLNLMIPRTKLF